MTASMAKVPWSTAATTVSKRESSFGLEKGGKTPEKKTARNAKAPRIDCCARRTSVSSMEEPPSSH